jgi:ribosomal protein S27E
MKNKNNIVYVNKDVDLTSIDKNPGHSSNISDEEFRGFVAKGKYDINYVITLLRIIEGKCHSKRLSPSDLRFSLQESCKQMITYLETERDVKTSKDPVIHLKCERCSFVDLVFSSEAKNWKCPICGRKHLELQ